MLCPQCHSPMQNLGNVSGIVLTSYPCQWTDTYACDDCKIKKDVHCVGSVEPSYGYLKDYKQV